MRATALISKNGEKIIIQKEKLFARLENEDISPEVFDECVRNIEPEVYEKREFAFRISDVKSWSANKKMICIEFKDGSFTYVQRTSAVISKLRIEFAL